MSSLRDRFRGCLLGAAIGDVAGAPVEAESPQFIARHYQSIDQILATTTVPELAAPPWPVGRFTDDTEMTLAVAHWLLADEAPDPAKLLARLAASYTRWRRYGPSTDAIFRMHAAYNNVDWRVLATSSFPHGSYGNGSATRVAPIALLHHRNPDRAAALAIESSKPTHCHPLALQGAAIHAAAIAIAATQDQFNPQPYLDAARRTIHYFAGLLHDTAPFAHAIDAIEDGLQHGRSCADLAQFVGTGITAQEAVPTALYCFLRHQGSYRDALHNAIFLGGDTDTIASMTGALAGARLGLQSIPPSWQKTIREQVYDARAILTLADQLYDKSISS